MFEEYAEWFEEPGGSTKHGFTRTRASAMSSPSRFPLRVKAKSLVPEAEAQKGTRAPEILAVAWMIVGTIVRKSGRVGVNKSGYRAAALPSVESAQDEENISPDQMVSGSGCRVGDDTI